VIGAWPETGFDQLAEYRTGRLEPSAFKRLTSETVCRRMSKRSVDILRTGSFESRGNSSDESSNDENDLHTGWNPPRSGPSQSASGASSVGHSTGFSGTFFTDEVTRDDKGGGPLARGAAVLNEAGRRHDRKTKDLVEKTMEVSTWHV
jgi:hypothetical protein